MSNDDQNHDFTGFTGFLDNNNFDYENFGMVDWLYNMGDDTDSHLYPSEAGGPSQPYAGVEVLGDPNSFPHPGETTTAPASMYPEGASLGEGESCSHSQDRRSEVQLSTTGFHPNHYAVLSGYEPAPSNPISLEPLRLRRYSRYSGVEFHHPAPGHHSLAGWSDI